MPIRQVTGPRGGRGYQWGTHGKVYPTRAGAVKQAQAAHAAGYKSKPKKK